MVWLLAGLLAVSGVAMAAGPAVELQTRLLPGPRVEVSWESFDYPGMEELSLSRERSFSLTEKPVWRGPAAGPGLVVDDQVDQGKTYRYWLRALDGDGAELGVWRGDWIDIKGKTEIPHSPPREPQVTVAVLEDTRVELVLGPAGADEWVIRYTVQRWKEDFSEMGPSWNLETGVVETGVPAPVTLLDSGLEPETRYLYAIRAVNANEKNTHLDFRLDTPGAGEEEPPGEGQEPPGEGQEPPGDEPDDSPPVAEPPAEENDQEQPPAVKPPPEGDKEEPPPGGGGSRRNRGGSGPDDVSVDSEPGPGVADSPHDVLEELYRQVLARWLAHLDRARADGEPTEADGERLARMARLCPPSLLWGWSSVGGYLQWLQEQEQGQEKE